MVIEINRTGRKDEKRIEPYSFSKAFHLMEDSHDVSCVAGRPPEEPESERFKLSGKK
jgi:hypothetical protein